ncbi:MAG: dockerin type I domain-containing protein [Clostridiales bacterium]|nr:dockerin type I domain-containing protein [Clostridiales bacterium]
MRKHTKYGKFFLCWALVLGLVCSTGVFAFADNDPVESGVAFVLSDDMDYIEATPAIYSAMAVTNPAALGFANVEVITSGSLQVLYRPEVYKGVEENNEDPDKYYTTRREFNLKDPRVFNIEFYLPLAEVVADGITPLTAEQMEALNNSVSYTYGGFPLSAWGDGNNLRGGTSIMLLSNKTITTVVDLSNPISPVAGYRFTASLRVNSPWASSSTGTNVPYAGFVAGSQNHFSGGRDWWMAGPAYKGTGTYELAAVANGEVFAKTNMHVGPYDEHYSWIEINEFAQDLIAAIKGAPLTIAELDAQPTGVLAAGYVKMAGPGYRDGYVKGDRATDVYVEVGIIGYGLTDNYHPDNKDYNNYSKYNAQWNITVAKDESTVAAYLGPGGFKEQMNTDPAKLMAKYKDAPDADIDMINVYYQNNVHSDEVTGTETMIRLVNDLIAGGKAGQQISYSRFNKDDVTLRYRRPAPGFTSGTSSHLLTGGYTGKFAQADSRVNEVFDTGAALDKFIFVNTLCSNPDGKAAMRRTNRYGIDLNRDCIYATHPETISLTQDIAKWDPMVMNEWHGYVTQMLIEPCTFPHSLSYEYDLLQNNMLQLAYQGGFAVLGSTGYDEFRIPWDQLGGGAWDDGGNIYGPMYAMLYGTYGYTIEFPHSNSDSFVAGNVINYAMVNTLLKGETAFYEGNLLNGPLPDIDGGTRNSHLEDNKYTSFRKSSVMNKLEYKLRGLENIDAMTCDKYFIDLIGGTETVVGRPRTDDPMNLGSKLNFFPDYLVIPTDTVNQYNPAEAIKALNFSMLVDCKVSVTTKDATYNGKLFPAGTYVYDFKQSNRNVLFEMMSKGYDATRFSSMYADIYCNYPDVRGFDSVQAWNNLNGGVDPFAGALAPVTAPIGKTLDIAGDEDEYVVFKSNSTDAVRFVNLLLSGRSSGPSFAEKGDVWMLRKAVDGVGNASDYVIKAGDLAKVGNLVVKPNLGLNGCHLVGQYISDLPKEAVKLVEPIITTNTTRNSATTGGNLFWSLDDYLGFNMLNADGTDYNGNSATAVRPGANVVLMNNATASGNLLNAIRNDKLGLIMVQSAATLGSFGFTAPSTGSFNDVAINGTYNIDDSLFTQNYAATDTLYARGNYFTANIPATAKILFTSLPDGEDAFIGGYQATNGSKTTFGNRTTMFSTILKEGITGKPVQSLNIGMNLYNRSHYQKHYPLLATAIYASAAGILDDFDAPGLFDVTGGKYNGGVAMNLVAEDDLKGSGVEKYEFYKWNGSEYAFVAEQASPAYDFAGLASNAFFKVVITDWAGNETTKWVEYDFIKDIFIIHDTDPLGGVLRLSVFGEETGYINQDVEFTIAARNATDVLTVNVTFEIDGGLLAFKGIEGLNGFDMINGVSWRSMGGDVWRGTITLGYPDSGTVDGTGFTNASYTDIGKLTFAPRAAGDVSVTLVKIDRVTGKVDLDVVDVEAYIENGVAITNIELVYSKYDLNRDGVVDALDLGMVLLYCGWDSDSPAWDTEIKVYDSHGKGVTAKTCDVNLDGVIDMLDLLDLFIHYTK